ncbi:hemicentin-1-like isoform X2 [Ornithodoros turicata]|uniref:hemicentin-1-like isoform X2 n=1 Tax=Ornithodoros turicata TaxID=34597 RepID=UPI003138CBEB
MDCPVLGDPEPLVSWYRHGHKMASSNRSVVLHTLGVHDAGTYKCTAVSAAGFAELNISLTVQVPPTLRSDGYREAVTATVGSAVRLSCESQGIPAPIVTWKDWNERLVETSERAETVGHSLNFPRGVRLEDAGVYTCVAQNEAGLMERRVNLTVVAPPSIENHTKSTLEVTIVEGQAALLQCSASGTPSPNVTWLKDGTPLESTKHAQQNASARIRIISKNGSALCIDAVDLSHSGRYVCLANNEAGTATLTYNLQVVVIPFFPSGDPAVSEHKVLLTHPFALTCDAMGVPYPSFAWYQDGIPLPSDVSTNVISNQLHIMSASAGATGRYCCEASNVAGSTQQCFNVTVLVPPQIFESNFPISISSVSCHPVAMECPATGVPQPSIVWYRSGSEDVLLSEEKVLKLPDVQPSDTGSYTCKATNEVGIALQEFVLSVLVPPKIRRFSKTRRVAAGERLALECIADGYPPPSFTWSWDGPFTLRRTFPVLSFDEVTKEHEGEYTCVAANEAGTDRRTVALLVSVPPTIQSSSEDVATSLGQPAILTCNAVGDPHPNVTWYKDSEVLKDDSEVYEILPNGLYIYKASTSDSGKYVCTAENGVGVAHATRKLRVLEPPAILTHSQDEKAVIQGHEISLTCKAHGNPPPMVRWVHNGAPVNASSSRVILVNDKELQIPFAQPEDTGEYKCVAENEAGSDTRTTLVKVHVPPKILRDENEESEVTSQRGAQATLHCSAEGNPPAHISWSREGDQVVSSRAEVQPSGDLVLMSLQAEDTGTYTCTAKNSAGTDEKLVSLVVLVPPSIIRLPRDTEVGVGDRLELECEADGTPTPHIAWMRDDSELLNDAVLKQDETMSILSVDPVSQQDGGMYACIAENKVGQRKAMAQVKVRVPPKILEHPSPQRVPENSTITLNCLADGDPLPQVFWLKDGKQLHFDEHFSQLHNNTLLVQFSQITDSGQYRCVTANKYGVAEAVADVTVTKEPILLVAPLGGVTDIGSLLTLDCHAVGEPSPQVSWKLDGRDVVQGGRLSVFPNGTLRILAVQEEDEGVYRCSANSSAGSSSASATVAVRVDGRWSLWEPWSQCPGLCGGKRVRKRLCNNPEPRNGGKVCDGPDREYLPCVSCEGSAWTEWEAWTVCSATCGRGIRYRRRRCQVPNESTVKCPGPDKETEECIIAECPVHGGWSEWSDWSSCSSTCGTGQKERTRQCDSPHPEHGGNKCQGETSQFTTCNERPCEVYGSWSQWSSWSHCSVSCGGGTKSRTRTCHALPPSIGGRSCIGNAIQVDFCNPQSCPIHGDWSNWSRWGQCSVSCGGGKRRRFRTCNNPVPTHGGRSCMGDDADEADCASTPCPDINECLVEEICQHQCLNTDGSYNCLCPHGYRVSDDGVTCQDIDECTEHHIITCEEGQSCFNIRGGYKCIDLSCPPGYLRDAEDGPCKLNCQRSQDNCSHGNPDIVEFRTAALPSGVEAGADVIRVAAYAHGGELYPNTTFTMLSADLPFSVSQKNGYGFVRTLYEPPPGALYRVTLQATSRDRTNATNLFTTRIIVFISISRYPY